MVTSVLRLPRLSESFRRTINNRFTEDEIKITVDDAVNNLRAYNFDDNPENEQVRMRCLVYEITTAETLFDKKIKEIHDQTYKN